MGSELSDALLGAGLLDDVKYKKVQGEHKKSGKDTIQILLDLKLATREEILQILTQEWNLPSVDVTKVVFESGLDKLIPKDFLKEKSIIPFGRQNGTILLAMQDPRDMVAIENVEMRFGIQVSPYIALGPDIKHAISKLFGESHPVEETVDEEEDEQKEAAEESQISHEELAEDAQELTAELLGSLKETDTSQVDVEKKEEVEDIMQVDTSAPEVEKVTNAIILEAIRLRASDIHIEPFEKKLLVRYRVDGALRKSSFKIPFTFRNALIAKIKIMGGMNITERRIPQDGRIAIKVSGKPYEFRVNVVPTVMGESAVLRILDRSGANLTLDQLGFLPDTKQKFLDSLEKPYGLILVCGPTGSGKSFTLMAALSAVRDPEEKILTAENPVEYNLEGVVQVQVNPDLSLGEGKRFDFSAALRSFLRQDPDTIMVGEIRDEETGHIACEAAMTGHLVLSTIHTNDATSVIGRLAEMGVPLYLVASTLECILAQRLIRTLCSKCKEPDKNPSVEMLQTLEREGIPIAGAKFMKPKGCPACGNKGLKGRTAIHELLTMSDEVKAICRPGVKNEEIRAIAIKSGMRTLMQDGLTKITMGNTTYQEILAAAK